MPRGPGAQVPGPLMPWKREEGAGSGGPLHHPPPAVGRGAAGGVSFITFLIFYVLPTADPAQLRAGRQPNPELVKQIRHEPRPRRPVPRAVLALHEAARVPLRLRLQLPEQRRRQDPALRSPPGQRLGGARRGRGLAARRDRGRDHLRRPPLVRARPLVDGAVPGGDLRPGLLARTRRPLPVRGRHREVPGLVLQGRGQLRPALAGSGDVVPVTAAAVVRACSRLRRALRASAASEPDRGDVGGLHPHRAREGAVRAAGHPATTACAARSRRSSPHSGSTSASCSAERSSSRLCSTSRASGGTPTTVSRTRDIPVIQGTVLLGAFFIVMANLVVDILYAFLDPRVRYS